MRPNKDGRGFEGEDDKLNFLYSLGTPGQIGNMKHQPVAAALGSPPFVDAREGSPRNPSSVAADQQLGASQVQITARATWGETPGQIGHMRGDAVAGVAGGAGVAGVVSSPPFAAVASRNRSQEPYALTHPERMAAYGTAAPNRHVDGYGKTEGQIGNAPETYAAACLQVYRECFRVVQWGGVLVLVTGNYVRKGVLIDLASDTIALAAAAGWTPVERWEHKKGQISFWRRLHHATALRAGKVPVTVTSEDIVVFCKGPAPGWAFAELPPTTRLPVVLPATLPSGGDETEAQAMTRAVAQVEYEGGALA
jgi:hypothetical protein